MYFVDSMAHIIASYAPPAKRKAASGEKLASAYSSHKSRNYTGQALDFVMLRVGLFSAV